MIVLDHLLFVVIAVVHPAVSYLSFKRLLRRMAAGETIRRRDLYNTTIMGHWTMFGVAMALWAGAGRDWPDLGFTLVRGDGFFAGVLLAVTSIGLLLLQNRRLSQLPDNEIQALKERLGSLDFVLPRSDRELVHFYGLSLTAGIVEEALWRGFLIWYLAHFMPIWAAALASAAWFGIAHLYQGIRNVPQIVAVGLLFATLFLLTGSLWIPMIVHAVIDISQGRLAHDVLTRPLTEDPPDEEAVAESG